MLKFIKTSVIGPGHITDDLPNQDSVGYFRTKRFWAIIACDGMGSRPLSNIGSKIAIESIKSVLKVTDFRSPAKTVIAEFYQCWLDAIKSRMIKPNDAVTTVLIAWGDNSGDFRWFQLGDGIICTREQVYTPKSKDEFSNLTTGLGLSKNFNDWSLGYGRLSGTNNSILLMTDGISEDITDHSGFTDALIKFSHNKSSRRIKKYLKNQLIHWPTPFHTDDKSLAMVILNDKK